MKPTNWYEAYKQKEARNPKLSTSANKIMLTTFQTDNPVMVIPKQEVVYNVSEGTRNITPKASTLADKAYGILKNSNKLYQYGEYRQPYQSELDYFKNNTNVGGMATEDNKIILNPYSTLNDIEKHQVGLNEGVRLFLRENPNYIGNFGLTNQQKQSLGNYSNNIDDIRSTILARILTNDPSAGNATIRQKFNANRVRNAINRGLGRYGLGN